MVSSLTRFTEPSNLPPPPEWMLKEVEEFIFYSDNKMKVEDMRSGLSAMTVKELRAMVKKYNADVAIQRYSSMKKADLIEAMLKKGVIEKLTKAPELKKAPVKKEEPKKAPVKKEEPAKPPPKKKEKAKKLTQKELKEDFPAFSEYYEWAKKTNKRLTTIENKEYKTKKEIEKAMTEIEKIKGEAVKREKDTERPGIPKLYSVMVDFDNLSRQGQAYVSNAIDAVNDVFLRASEIGSEIVEKKVKS